MKNNMYFSTTMRETTYLITIVSILLLILNACGIDCLDKKTPRPGSCSNVDEAKDNEVYMYAMYPLKSEYEFDSVTKFIIKDVWVEHCWQWKCVNNEAVVKKDTLQQLVIDAEYIGNKQQLDYVLWKYDMSSGISIQSQKHFIYSNQDTFKLFIARHTDFNKEIIDSISFLRRMN